jgi:sterol 3beta-glucosyltransferase
MHVLLTSFGTRGDVQPYAALAGALARAGHRATLATAEGFHDLAPDGVELASVGSEMLRLIEQVMPELSGARDALKTFRIMKDATARQNDELWDAAQAAQPDVVVYHPKLVGAASVAEALGVPGVLSLPLPYFTPTSAFRQPLFGAGRSPSWLNRASYLVRRTPGLAYGDLINGFRRRIGLKPTGRLADPLVDGAGRPVHVLYPYSRHVVPVPSDYPSTAHVTGYWFLDSPNWTPPAELVDFLSSGPPPVYLGFGSMGFGKGADERRDALLSALAKNRLRGIVATGWGGITPGPAPTDDVLVIDSVPHDWLFPQVAAVVHHGGAGSTAAGLRAGRPTQVVPFLGDQPFWGGRVHAIGAGPAPLPAKRLAGGLAERLSALISERSYARRAAGIGELLRAEDGPANAIDVLESLPS